MMLLNGVIDCPDIPLNVSRSFLQNDSQVQKISKHITKKVADKLTALFNNDREHYEKCWKDVSTFIKFGCLKDEEFYKKVEKILIFKSINGEYKCLEDLLGEEIEDEDAKNGVLPKAVYYVTNEVQQAQYIAMFKDAGLDAVICDTLIDGHFISYVEYKNAKKVRFVSIDADVDGVLTSGTDIEEDEKKALIELVKNCLVNKEITVRVERFKSGKLPAVVNTDEFTRRMSEMNELYGIGSNNSVQETLVLNLTNPVVSSILTQNTEKQGIIINQIYYLAMLSYKQLSSEELADFVDKSASLLFEYSK